MTLNKFCHISGAILVGHNSMWAAFAAAGLDAIRLSSFSSIGDEEKRTWWCPICDGIKRTLEPGVDGQHTPYTWKRQWASRLLESR